MATTKHRAHHARRRARFVGALVGAVPLVASCQVLLGIDPSSRNEAAVDGSIVDAAGLLEASALDGASEGCRSDLDCTGLSSADCEKGTCSFGECIVTAATGSRCGLDGTCRGYACIGSDVVLASADYTTCLRDSRGLVWCWGDEFMGLVGNQGDNRRLSPYLLSAIGDGWARASSVAAGLEHMCAVLDDHHVVCWGSDDHRQASTDPNDEGHVLGPTLTDAPASRLVAPGAQHTCALSTSNEVWCWGDNALGEIGTGFFDPSIVGTPTRVDFPNVLRLSSGGSTVCAADDSSLECWGDNTWGQIGSADRDAQAAVATPNPIDFEPTGTGRSPTTGVAVGEVNVCVISAGDGTVWCWGNDRSGQLGDGVTYSAFGTGTPADFGRSEPSRVVYPDGSTVVGASALVGGRGDHFCALTRDHTSPVCWGQDLFHELGVGPTGFFPSAQIAAEYEGALQLSLGRSHMCFLRAESDGYDISCAGSGTHGQLAQLAISNDEDSIVPLRVQFPSDVGGIGLLRQRQAVGSDD